MAVDKYITRNLRDGVLTVLDGTAVTPLEVEVLLAEGDLSLKIASKDTIIVKDRGALDHLRAGDEVPVEVGFSIKFTEFLQETGDANPTLYEVLTRTGAASAYISTNDKTTDVYCVDLQFELSNPEASPIEAEKIVLPCFFIESIDFSEGDEYNTLSVTGKSFVTRPTITKVTIP